VEISDPSFYSIESDSLRDHVLAAFAPDMEGSLVSDFSASNFLSFDDLKGFIFSKTGLFGRDIFRVVVFGNVKVISSGSSKSAHNEKI
jgi:hypothetical protein